MQKGGAIGAAFLSFLLDAGLNMVKTITPH